MQRIDPPNWADKFLEWFCAKHLLEFIQGDLHELYEKRAKIKGRKWANIHFILDVLSTCRPFAFKKKRYNSNNYAMFKNYYKVAVRNLMRHKMYSSIKIGGFALGIAACLVIALFIKDELGYDEHYPDKERIYRVINQWNDPDQASKWPAHQAPMASVMREEIPELEKVGRIISRNWFNAGNNLVSKPDKKQQTYEGGFAYADQDFIEILQLPMVYGDLSTALTEPNSIVITKTKADKYFPGENPIGEMLILNDDTENVRKITGVIADLPTSTYFDFNFLMTLTGVEFWPGEQTSWCCNNYSIYFKARADANPDNILEKLYSIKENHIIKDLVEKNKSDVEEYQKHFGYEIQRIEDVHLGSRDIMAERYQHGDIRIVYMFMAIALLILLLASINFVNLSTAKSANRAKEVGLRKVVGSHKKNLIGQFLTESVLFSFVSLLIGLLLATLILPFFNQMADKSLSIPWTDWWFVPSLLLSISVIGILAGLYPSFYLSKFRPIEVLKGKLSLGNKNSFVQGGMVVFQFVASVVLIIGALVVNRQMGFILNSNLGFDKDQIVMIQGTFSLGDRLPTFRNELAALPEVKDMTSTSYFPVAGTSRDQNEFWNEGRVNIDAGVGAQIWRVDDRYIPTLGMNVLEGRNFSQELASDSNAMVINQAFAEVLGLKEPLGKRITNGGLWNIVGVVENFHFESITGEVRPLSMVPANNPSVTAVKINSDDLLGSMNEIIEIWDKMVPNQSIRYEFMDESFAAMYRNVKKTGEVFTVFATLAIVIACLGLFALTAFMIEQKRKEIGIRKVLGASSTNLFQALTSNFFKLIALSFVIAFPAGWYVMQGWLEDYEYGITLTWDLLLISGLIILVISILTISYEIVRALKMNPADTLHSE